MKRTVALPRNKDSVPEDNTNVLLQYDTPVVLKSATYNNNISNIIDTNKRKPNVEHNKIRTTKVLQPATTANNITNTDEVTHVVFLKVHKAASSTVQRIFLRFGLERNLSFVIPTPTHYISTQKYFFSDIWPSLHGTPNERGETCGNISPKYDMLIHHMVFNHRKVSQLLHSDTIYVAVVRDPFDLFVSAAGYYKFAIKPSAYLDKLSNETFITDLIRNPKQFEATTLSESMTYNSMSYDFGLECLNIRKPEMCTDYKFAAFLNTTKDSFDIVMVVEKFDESMVLLRRRLNWSMKDILYVKINTFTADRFSDIPQSLNITADDMATFRERNKFDYELYKLFKDRLEEQISNQKDLKDEVSQFRNILNKVNRFCSREGYTGASLSNSSKGKQNPEESDENSKFGKDSNIINIELLKVIKIILKTKIVSRRREEELLELFDLIESGRTKTTIVPISKLLPLLFEDKMNTSTSESKLFIAKSKWNKDFYVTTRDCVLMTKDSLSLYEVLKRKHLKVLIENKFGNFFSLHEAVEYLSTFT